jgi:hypothetical protein
MQSVAAKTKSTKQNISENKQAKKAQFNQSTKNKKSNVFNLLWWVRVASSLAHWKTHRELFHVPSKIWVLALPRNSTYISSNENTQTQNKEHPCFVTFRSSFFGINTEGISNLRSSAGANTKETTTKHTLKKNTNCSSWNLVCCRAQQSRLCSVYGQQSNLLPFGKRVEKWNEIFTVQKSKPLPTEMTTGPHPLAPARTLLRHPRPWPTSPRPQTPVAESLLRTMTPCSKHASNKVRTKAHSRNQTKRASKSLSW